MNFFSIARAARNFCLFFLCISVAHAQEGHPMSGVWVGDWSVGDVSKRVVIVLDWSGTELVGTINPGPNAVAVKTATANPDDWSLHMEAAGTDATGQPAAWVIDGKIDDLGTYNRSIAGSWNVGAAQGTFSITRQ